MPDLREQLAERFANIFLPRLGDGTPYSGLVTFQKQEWRKLADECIRQMEWVKYEHYRGDHSFHDRPGTAPVPHDCYKCQRFRAPVTAAPDDWNPKCT